MFFQVIPSDIGHMERKVVGSFLDTENPLAPMRQVGAGPPSLEPYSAFYPGGPLYFLSRILPLEIWYIIFEWKFWLEKVDYVMTHFGPSVIEGIRMNESGKWVFKPMIPSLVSTLHQDVRSLASTCAEECRTPGTLDNLKWFLIRWYPIIVTLENIYNSGGQWLSFDGSYYMELFSEQETGKLYAYKNFCSAIRRKVDDFYSEITGSGHCLISRIRIHDLRHYLDVEARDIDPLWVDRQEPYDKDFEEYFVDFDGWHERFQWEDPLDVLELVTENPIFYVNPFWFEDVDGQPAIWRMINGEI
jgi:hypothetical protein